MSTTKQSDAERRREAQVLDDANLVTRRQRAACRAYADLLGESLEYAAEHFGEAYYGHFRSSEEFAKEFAESTGQVDPDDWLHGFVDWSEVADDLTRYDFDAAEAPDGGVYIFAVI